MHSGSHAIAWAAISTSVSKVSYDLQTEMWYCGSTLRCIINVLVAAKEQIKINIMKCKVIVCYICLCVMMVACSAGNKSEMKNASSIENFKENNFEIFSAELGVFIKLDTRTGEIWQVHYDAGGNCQIDALNTTSFVKNGVLESGRFTLYPSVDKFSFILLDKKDGRTWLVHWAINKDYQAVIPLK